MKKRIILVFLSHLLVFYFGYNAYRYGIENNNKIFPITKFLKRNFLESKGTKSSASQRKINVFSEVSLKSKVLCPKPENAYVIIGFGQSNSANSAGHRFEGNGNAVNYFDGSCYIASDPMLGTTGRQGSLWLPLSNRLQVGEKTIVLATFGVDGTRVEQWLDGNYLYPFYKENLSKLKETYPSPDAAVWIQGESDVATPKENFELDLAKWLTILSKDLPQTTLYITGTSYCSGNASHSVLEAQKRLSQSLGGVYVGSTDSLVQSQYRYDDCHFSEKGVNALADLISSSWVK